MNTVEGMKAKVEQIYTGCLAEAAYYIESNGEAAIIDPLRETQPYLDKLAENGAKLKYIFETHFHADFVSGHIDLAKKTGATIVFGPNANPSYDVHVAQDLEELKIGDVTIRVLHTPGHTMESTSYLLMDEQGVEKMVFTGDTLFIGDVGRPDLAVKTDLTREDLASHLFDSLREKLMVLPDETIVYPGHGAGSACGKNMSSETWDTLGHQKDVNYALREDMTKDEFVKEVTEGLSEPPQYFGQNVMMNKTGYVSFDEVMAKGDKGLTPEEFEEVANQTGAIILDVRSQEDFAKGHVPNAIFIGLDGNFAPWVGALITDLKQPILIVAPEGREEETITRLSRVGYDNPIGYLKDGFAAWADSEKEMDDVPGVTAEELADLMKKEDINVLDVRRESEYLSERVKGAENFPLDYINKNMDKLDTSKTYHVHCAGGYRSMVAISILKARGYHNFVDVRGGFKAIAETDIPKTDYVCPSTL